MIVAYLQQPEAAVELDGNLHTHRDAANAHERQAQHTGTHCGRCITAKEPPKQRIDGEGTAAVALPTSCLDLICLVEQGLQGGFVNVGMQFERESSRFLSVSLCAAKIGSPAHIEFLLRLGPTGIEINVGCSLHRPDDHQPLSGIGPAQGRDAGRAGRHSRQQHRQGAARQILREIAKLRLALQREVTGLPCLRGPSNGHSLHAGADRDQRIHGINRSVDTRPCGTLRRGQVFRSC